MVFLIDTDSRFDFPSSRATQLQDALNYLVNSSVAASRIDRNRLAVGGHSMGGGGSLIAADRNAALQAAVPLQPWNTSTNFSGVNVPTMIVGAENDTIASVTSHSEPFYNSIPAASEKAYAELNGASHGVGTTANVVQAKSMIVWLKRYVDNDTRYEQFICPPPPAPSSELQEYRHLPRLSPGHPARWRPPARPPSALPRRRARSRRADTMRAHQPLMHLHQSWEYEGARHGLGFLDRARVPGAARLDRHVLP